jgi:hypothetical protein
MKGQAQKVGRSWAMPLLAVKSVEVLDFEGRL